MPPADDEAASLEGREAELSALESALEQACQGHGRTVVVSGEAGIGKSSLVTKLAELGARRGAAIVWGRAWEFADAPAYFPVWPCLASLGLEAEGAQSGAPFELWEGVLAALSSACSQQPQIWLLEDLHAADLQTLDLLAFLAQPLRVLRALIVITARPGDPRLSERAEQRLLRIARDGLDLRLGPLAAESVERLARRHSAELSRPAFERLLEVTSGNPLFVIEWARALKAGGTRGASPVPTTIRQVVLERAGLLPTSTRELLESGAVVGREFSASLVARMHGLLSARVVDGLLPALRNGLLLERAPGSFFFSHVVVQEALYASLSAERRHDLHSRAERALGQLPLAPELLLERARHALGGLSPDHEDQVLALVLEAGRALEASGAFDRAHALYERLRHKIAHGEISRPLGGSQLLHFASVAERAGRSAESRRISLTVMDCARADGAWQLFAQAALELGRGLRPGMVDGELVAALREALTKIDDASSALSCRLLARLAAALQPAPDPQQPVRMAAEAIARAEQSSDPALRLEVLEMAGSAYVDYAPIELRLQTASAFLELSLRAGDDERVLRARARLAFDRARQGDFAAYASEVSEMLRGAGRGLGPTARIRPLLMASLGASMRGKLRESDAYLAEAGQLLSLTDEPALKLSFQAHALSRALMLHHDRDLERAEAMLDGMVQGVPDSDVALAALRAATRARLERLEPTREDVRRAWARNNPAEPGFLPSIAEAAAFARELEICAGCHRLLSPLVGSEALGGHVSVSYEGPVDRLLGLLETALGRFVEAEPKLRAALALAERRGFHVWVAQGRYDLGNLLAQTGRADEARESFRAAAELGQACDMSGLVARAGARLAGAAASAPDLVSPVTEPAPSLTMTREGELYWLKLGSLSVRVRATRGAELLARLIEVPHQEVHVLALAADEGGPTFETNAGERLDRTALVSYKRRLGELGSLIAQAEADADRGRLEALCREQAALEREVRGALGLGGRVRAAGSATERARVNVQRRLKDVLERIGEASPELGAWLGRAVRTGTYCSYSPNN